MIANEVDLAEYERLVLVTEHDHQTALFNWIDRLAPLYPGLRLIFAVPNGGKRHPKVAAKMREEGLRPGVPDLFCAVPSQGWHGLFIEMKIKGNKPTGYQLDWLEKLQAQGYLALTCYGVNEAKAAIRDYLGIDAPH